MDHNEKTYCLTCGEIIESVSQICRSSGYQCVPDEIIAEDEVGPALTDEQFARLSAEGQASESMVGMLRAYEEMGLIKLTPDGTGIDHITDFGMATLYWMSALLSQTLSPTATVRPIRRARDRAFKMTEAMADLLEFLNQQQAQAN